MSIPLGFEVGSGRRIEIPLRHTAVFGQTQESGKTTTLEGLISRSGLRGLAFVTKRGESSFHVMNPIAPYFRERTDWQFVAAILEATLSEKLKFQRPWIMKLCEAGRLGYSETVTETVKGKEKNKTKRHTLTWEKPRTLADVLGNVEIALHGARGMNESIYYELREYLRQIIPQLDRLPYTTTLELAPGVNVMDLAAYDFPLQALVVRSSMEWIRRREHDCVLVVPESHKFAPKQRGSPVKLEAEDFIRESAALKNFLWIDCQDVAGVADVLLRQIGVWIFGVQRARHEIERTLDAIPEGLLSRRPKAGEIATLSKGQFFVCWGREMWKVYVQPAWMTAAHAEAIAREEESVETAREILKDFDREHKPNVKPKPAEKPAPRDAESDQAPDRAPGTRAADGDVDGRADRAPVGTHAEPNVAGKASFGGEIDKREGNPMPNWQEKYEALKAEYDTLVATHDAIANRVAAIEAAFKRIIEEDRKGNGNVPAAAIQLAYNVVQRQANFADSPARTGVHAQAEVGAVQSSPSAPAQSEHWKFVANSEALDEIWRYMLNRAADDGAPRLLAILASRPELRVTIERQTIEARGDTLRGALGILISEHFFKNARAFGDIRVELIRRGFLASKAPNRQVSQAIEGLVELGFLTREADGYQAVAGMKIHILESVAQVARA